MASLGNTVAATNTIVQQQHAAAAATDQTSAHSGRRSRTPPTPSSTRGHRPSTAALRLGPGPQRHHMPLPPLPVLSPALSPCPQPLPSACALTLLPLTSIQLVLAPPHLPAPQPRRPAPMAIKRCLKNDASHLPPPVLPCHLHPDPAHISAQSLRFRSQTLPFAPFPAASLRLALPHTTLWPHYMPSPPSPPPSERPISAQ